MHAFTTELDVGQSEPQGQITPLASYRHFDRVHVWLRKPLNKQQLRPIADQCERGWPKGVEPHYKPCPFHPGYRMRLELYQPSRKAFEVLAEMTSTDEPLINYVEIAWDQIFNDQNEADHSVEYFFGHLVQPWHRKSMKVHAYYKWDEDTDGTEYFRNYPVGWTTKTIRRGKRGRIGHWFSGYSSQAMQTDRGTKLLPCRG